MHIRNARNSFFYLISIHFNILKHTVNLNQIRLAGWYQYLSCSIHHYSSCNTHQYSSKGCYLFFLDEYNAFEICFLLRVVYPAKNLEKFGFYSDGYVYGKTMEGSYVKLRQNKYYNIPIETWWSVEISLAAAKFYDRYTIVDYVDAFTLDSGKAYSGLNLLFEYMVKCSKIKFSNLCRFFKELLLLLTILNYYKMLLFKT